MELPFSAGLMDCITLIFSKASRKFLGRARRRRNTTSYHLGVWLTQSLFPNFQRGIMAWFGHLWGKATSNEMLPFCERMGGSLWGEECSGRGCLSFHLFRCACCLSLKSSHTGVLFQASSRDQSWVTDRNPPTHPKPKWTTCWNLPFCK